MDKKKTRNKRWE